MNRKLDRMGNWRVRTHALLALGSLLWIPWLLYVATTLIEYGSLPFGQDRPVTAPQVGAMVGGLLLAILFVGARMRSAVVRPLERLAEASRRIADGDWEARMPSSAVLEIAEVSDGFDAMMKGLRAANLERAKLEEQRRFVVAAVAHDLRTPLFALRGYLDGLEQGIADTPERMAKYVAVCKEKTAQLDRLVEELFAYAQTEYAQTKLDDGPLELAGVMSRSLDSVRPQAERKELELVFDADDSGRVVGDRHLLERALSNLLDNAVRHAPSRGRIELRCRSAEGRVLFEIRDSGPGFSEDELERAFEPLFRGERSRNRATGGSGLGLSIAQSIVRRHGGELAVSNLPGGGGMAHGWLPLRPITESS